MFEKDALKGVHLNGTPQHHTPNVKERKREEEKEKTMKKRRFWEKSDRENDGTIAVDVPSDGRCAAWCVVLFRNPRENGETDLRWQERVKGIVETVKDGLSITLDQWRTNERNNGGEDASEEMIRNEVEKR